MLQYEDQWLHRHSVILKPVQLVTRVLSVVILFVRLFHILQPNRGEVEDYSKWELIGGGAPRHLITFSNRFSAAVHTHMPPSQAISYNNAQENITAVILVEDLLWPPLDMVTVDQERAQTI